MITQLDLLCPGVKSASATEKQAALDYAVRKRPSCLSADEQDEAQVYYAGYLLVKGLSQSNVTPAGVTSEREGDLSRSYGDSGLGDDPLGYLQNYQKLRAKCFGLNIPLERS